MIRTFGRLAAAAAVVLTLAGCSSDDASPNDGSMTMLLTDAPSDSITAAVVTIEQVYLQGGSDSATTNGRVVLRSDPITVDLLTLANTAESLFVAVGVPGGEYSQLRMVISGGYLAVTQGDGSTKIYASSPSYPGLPVGATVGGTLQMPSYATSGLKVTLPASVLNVDGDHVIVLLDFDVAQSFGHQAGPDRWVMHPVVQGTEISMAGAVHGTVTLAAGVVLSDSLLLNGFTVQLGSETRSLFALGGGAYGYAFDLLVPGSYQLQLNAPVGMTLVTNPVNPLGVTVVSGTNTTVNLVITSAN